MNLLDGHIIYPQLTIAEFTAETATWSPGVHAVLCDDAAQAYTDLAPSLIAYNAILSRNLTVYNYDSDEIVYYRTEAEPYLFHIDKIYRIEWRFRAVFLGRPAYPSTNTNGEISSDILREIHKTGSTYCLLFLTLPEYITGVDALGSQIAYDYTYLGGKSNHDFQSYKNYHMKRTSNLYYVYDQEGNFFYRFP